MALLAICLVSAAPVGCDRAKTAPTVARPAGTVPVQIGNATYNLEVAATNRARQNGLMNRKSMPDDHGMAFVFTEPQELRFYMRNTLIPLDILYLDAQARVVSIKQMQPLDETSIPSEGLSRYAIELNQGQAARCGVKPGDTIALPSEITDPPHLE